MEEANFGFSTAIGTGTSCADRVFHGWGFGCGLLERRGDYAAVEALTIIMIQRRRVCKEWGVDRISDERRQRRRVSLESAIIYE